MTSLTAEARLSDEILPVKEELADLIQKELQRNGLDHCYIHAAELDRICPDREAREIYLSQLADKNGFALAWYYETIGAIFIEPRHAGTGRGQPRKEVSRPSQQPPTTST